MMPALAPSRPHAPAPRSGAIDLLPPGVHWRQLTLLPPDESDGDEFDDEGDEVEGPEPAQQVDLDTLLLEQGGGGVFVRAARRCTLRLSVPGPPASCGCAGGEDPPRHLDVYARAIIGRLRQLNVTEVRASGICRDGVQARSLPAPPQGCEPGPIVPRQLQQQRKRRRRREGCSWRLACPHRRTPCFRRSACRCWCTAVSRAFLHLLLLCPCCLVPPDPILHPSARAALHRGGV